MTDMGENLYPMGTPVWMRGLRGEREHAGWYGGRCGCGGCMHRVYWTKKFSKKSSFWCVSAERVREVASGEQMAFYTAVLDRTK